ncbi:MAG: hypothetical protein JXR96_14940 [Deltaproteobacteria bacterium]|nr:hypothetical protein [Deltaproteobacteria bacterium]
MVVVDNERNLNLGRVVYSIQSEQKKRLRKVLRRVGPQDVLLIRRNKKREEEACTFCQKRIEERNLPMKLVRVAYLHGGNKAVFFFTADGRVDFRSLVRDLAQQLHVRIEMRQIGVRDEAKILGGIGICGQPLCCSRFLRKFVPVSIKMAKNQNLALNPQKVSGLCGRLMCCLVYEDEIYRLLRRGFPKQGKTIETPRGPGKVIELDILRGRIRIALESGITTMTLEELHGERAEPAQEPPEPEESDSAQEPRKRGRRRRKGRPPHPKPDAQAGTAEGDGGAGPDEARADRPEPGDQEPQPASDEKKKSSSERKRRSRRRSQRRRKRRAMAKTDGSGETKPSS